VHDFLATSLLLGGLVSVLATIPQAAKLIKAKRSDELSLASWIIWFAYQLISIAYSVSIQAWTYVLINACWAVFYALMVGLIIKYRFNTSSNQQFEPSYAEN